MRGLEFSRVDAFTDVVFGFALTLLVVSLEVPKTYAELHAVLRGFLPFGACFAILIRLWAAHFWFSRRFGLHDTVTIVLNCVLMFLVLFLRVSAEVFDDDAAGGLATGENICQCG